MRKQRVPLCGGEGSPSGRLRDGAWVDAKVGCEGPTRTAKNIDPEVGNAGPGPGEGRVPPAPRQGGRRHPNVSADPGDEGRERKPGWGGGGGDCAAVALHEGAVPQDPFVPLIRLPAPAEGRHRGPAPVAPEQPAALEDGATAVGEARRHERPVGRDRPPAAAPEPREDGSGRLSGARHGPQEGAVAGPGEAVQGMEIRDDLRAERIEVEIADEFQEVRLLLHDDGLVPVLKEVPHPVMVPIEGPGVAGEQGAHAAGEGALAGPDQKMRMVGQEGPGVNRPRPGPRHGGQAGHEVGPVAVIAEERGPLNPARHDVVEGRVGVEAWLPGHDAGQSSTSRHRMQRPVLVRTTGCKRRLGFHANAIPSSAQRGTCTAAEWRSILPHSQESSDAT